MDPNPKDVPLLCYLLSRFDSNFCPSLLPELEDTVLTQMPHLSNPKVLASVTQAIPMNISQTQSMLRALGPRPDPSAVAVARAKVAQLQSKLQRSFSGMESHAREAAEKEMQIYGAVVRLEEMHEAYQKQLRDAEEKMVGVYGSVVAELENEGEFETNEEVVRILREAQSRPVERVELPDRQLRFLPEEFGKLHGLIVLNLSRNQLQMIPDSIAGLTNLEELDVSSNLLESLPDSIGLLLNLRILNVSGNKLKALSEGICRCSSLVELDASFNILTSLPANIGGLVNLERLSIRLNKLRFLPPSICEIRSLRYLDAHFNALKGLPSAIGKLYFLEVLKLSNNFSDLTELPESISDLSNLRELDLSNNQIRVLPLTFCKLEKLTMLNLDENPLITPPLEVANNGAEAVKDFMAKRLVEVIEEERQKSQLEANREEAETGWFSWGTSMFTNVVSGAAHKVSGFFGSETTYVDPWLNEER